MAWQICFAIDAIVDGVKNCRRRPSESSKRPKAKKSSSPKPDGPAKVIRSAWPSRVTKTRSNTSSTHSAGPKKRTLRCFTSRPSTKVGRWAQKAASERFGACGTPQGNASSKRPYKDLFQQQARCSAHPAIGIHPNQHDRPPRPFCSRQHPVARVDDLDSLDFPP